MAAAVVVLALVGGGLGMVLTRDEEPQRSAEVAEDRAGSSDSETPDDSDDAAGSDGSEDSGDAGDAADEPTATPGTDAPTPASTPSPAGARCWDGTTATSVDLCSRPEGLAGLSYVFPSMAGQDCRDITGAAHAPGRKLLLQCFDYLPDGTQIKINYSQWGSVRNGTEHYTGKGLVSSEVSGVYVFTGVADDGQYNTVGLYVKEPYSISLYAPTQSAMTEVGAMIEPARPADQVRGEPLG